MFQQHHNHVTKNENATNPKNIYPPTKQIATGTDELEETDEQDEKLLRLVV